jgi:hypothetical protein
MGAVDIRKGSADCTEDDAREDRSESLCVPLLSLEAGDEGFAEGEPGRVGGRIVKDTGVVMISASVPR